MKHISSWSFLFRWTLLGGSGLVLMAIVKEQLCQTQNDTMKVSRAPDSWNDNTPAPGNHRDFLAELPLQEEQKPG